MGVHVVSTTHRIPLFFSSATVPDICHALYTLLCNDYSTFGVVTVISTVYGFDELIINKFFYLPPPQKKKKRNIRNIYGCDTFYLYLHRVKTVFNYCRQPNNSITVVRRYVLIAVYNQVRIWKPTKGRREAILMCKQKKKMCLLLFIFARTINIKNVTYI